MPKLTTEEFIKRAREVHGDKYDYSKVEYVNSKEKVTIICPKHGEFPQTPQKHLYGRGCVKCHRDSIAKRYSLGKEKFIAKATAIHNGFYDYSAVEYVNSNTYVQIICPIHGSFEQVPASHLKGHGCPFCGVKTRSESKTKWNRKTCYEEAKKHKSRINFKLSAPTAYKKARKNGWFNDYTWFISLRKELGYWTKEQCMKEAQKYKTKTEFMIANPAAYTVNDNAKVYQQIIQ